MIIRQRLLVTLWPAFLVAGVLEALVFAVLDPAEMRWFGGELIGWSPEAIYSVSFLVFWVVISIATGLTALLLVEAGQINSDPSFGQASGEPGPGSPGR